MKPILFSAPMVQAIQEGRKTQTRRLVSPKNDFINAPDMICSALTDGNIFAHFRGIGYSTDSAGYVAKYHPGDILWVRETWSSLNTDDSVQYAYKATASGETIEAMQDYKLKWKPSIHMPKDACRIFLKVTNVRVERLNDISEEDAIAEGILVGPEGLECWNYLKKDWGQFGFSAEESFRTLWQSINGPGSWEKNPFVWVYEFERIEKPEVKP